MDTITEEKPRPDDEKPVYSGEMDGGIAAAAAEVTAARELGNTETLADEKPPERDESPIEEIKLKALDERKVDYLGFDKGVTVKDAAEALSDYRAEKLAERQKFEAQVMGSPFNPDDYSPTDPKVQSVRDALDAHNQAVTDYERNVAEYEANQQRIAQAEARAAQAEARANMPVQATLNTVEASLRANFSDAIPWLEQGMVDAYQYELQKAGDPRARQFQELRQAAIVTHQQAAQQQQRAQFQEAAAREDARWGAQHPEMKNPKVAETLRQGAIDYLREVVGLNDEQINHHWNVAGTLRTAEAQNMLLDATRTYLAKKGIANRPAAKVRPVQRPGTASHGSGAYREAGIKELDQRLSESGNVKDAARLVAERRRSR